jgi:DNA-binding response OmpR family regulator
MKDGKYVILYVDDDQDVLDSSRVVLESNGYVMVEAASAEDGMKVYKAAKPDLLIVDLMMEEVDAGTRLVRELKAEGNTKPVYMLSSVGDGLSMNIDPAALGLSGVLQKPVDSNVLLTLIKAKLSH